MVVVELEINVLLYISEKGVKVTQIEKFKAYFCPQH